MTKKDYELLARVLHSVKPNSDEWLSNQEVWEDAVLAISRAMIQQNPRFKEAQFLKACNEGLPDKDK